MKVFKHEQLASDALASSTQLMLLVDLLSSGKELDIDNSDALLNMVRELPLAVRDLTTAVNRHLSMGQQGKDSTLYDSRGKLLKVKAAPKAKAVKASTEEAANKEFVKTANALSKGITKINLGKK